VGIELEPTVTGEYVDVDLGGARFRNVNLAGARIAEAMLLNARISGLITGLVVNDIEVEPLIEAELNRRYPDRARLRPDDADGVRAAWSIIEELWAETKARVATLPDAMLSERVDGEWSFLETLRHLVFVTDLWIVTPVLGRTDSYHPLGLPPSFMTDTAALGLDPAAAPTRAEVIAAREGRMQIVRDLVATLTDERLDAEGPQGTVRQCVHTLLNEEWHHNWYANRDLDALTS
jgi:hypothetical protein